MTHQVLLTEDASRDLIEILEYIADHDSPARAQHVLDRIDAVLQGLTALPERGAYPGELLALGIREYREVFFKPHRVVYRVAGERVYVYLVADGRRDMQSLLARRLLAG